VGRVPQHGVVERLVRSIGDRLEPGGVATFIGNWEVRAGETWRDRWDGWLAGSDLDAWVGRGVEYAGSLPPKG
jgi:hypothetical protein